MGVLTVVFILYFLFLAAMLTGWKKAMNIPSEEVKGKEPLISVLVPVRNEELRISALLDSLSFQEYRNFEIIIINDDSQDETLWMIGQSHLKNIHVINSPGKGKKAAITAGVRVAKGSIIVTTDADCIVSTRWLKHIRACFRDEKVKFAFGSVRMQGDNSFFDSLQTMEFSSLVGTGAATAALGHPTLCNGANLAFRKNVFQTVKGYEGNEMIPSGDDEFLMRKVHRQYPDGIRFINQVEATVTTSTQRGPMAFINQRLRWASKWRYNTSIVSTVLALLVVMFQVAFIVNWFYVFSPFILQAFFLIVVKMILEASFLLQVCRFLQTPWNWLAFFSLQFIYPFYVVGVGVASFLRPFEWKQRVFKPY
jgi:biofilm PGA synthesis N-glycosyltransferase PgaC